MSEAWIGLVGALAGTAVGGLITHLIERARFSREASREWVNLRRTKLEEIGKVTEELRLAYAEVAIAARAWKNGDRDSIHRLKEVTPPLARLVVLDHFYAPELETSLGALAGKLSELKAAMQDIATQPRLGSDRVNEDAYEKVLSTQAEFDDQCSSFLFRLVDVAKALSAGTAK